MKSLTKVIIVHSIIAMTRINPDLITTIIISSVTNIPLITGKNFVNAGKIRNFASI